MEFCIITKMPMYIMAKSINNDILIIENGSFLVILYMSTAFETLNRDALLNIIFNDFRLAFSAALP